MLALVGINIFWAGSSVAAKVALEYISPMTLAFLRFSVAAVLMYLTSRMFRVDLRVARSDWPRFWAMGVLGLAFTYVLTYVGMRYTMASHAALLIATEPVFIAILSAVFLRERLRGTRVLAILVGLAGVYIIVNNGVRPVGVSVRLVGDALITLALVCEAMASVVGKQLVSRYHPMAVISYEMTIGGLALAPFASWELFGPLAMSTQHHGVDAHMVSCATLPGGPGHLALTSASAWAVLYLILPCTVLGYTVWYTLLEGRDAGEMSVSLYIQPAVGALLGWYFLGDHITAYTLGGGALVFVALFVLTMSRARTGPIPPATD